MITDTELVQDKQKNKEMRKCQELQFLKCPVEAGTKRESISIDPHVKTSNVTAEISMFIAQYEKRFWSLQLISLFMITVQGVNFYIVPPFEWYSGFKLCISLLQS